MKKRRADIGPRARFSAARFAAVTVLVCGLAAAADITHAADTADDAPASRTPLADTGLWEPPVLQPDSLPAVYKRIPIPADEGLAAFYGTYKPGSSHEIVLIDRIVLGPRDIHFFGNDDRSVRDYTVQYRVLHQGENYVLVKFRTLFSQGRIVTGDVPEKVVGFGVFAFVNSLFQIRGCKPTWYAMFEPDTYDQTPERDIADLTESGIDDIMRREFAKGEPSCGGGGGFGVYGSRRD
ncbi:MAG: hypothetical protein ACYYKD_04925 [Rhodospirillales bacterium]